MRKLWLATGVAAAVAGLGLTAWTAPYLYKWVKDRRVSSDRVLPGPQRTRVVPLPEDQALELVRRVMVEDLFLGLAEYHKTKHIQDGETTSDSVLPEAVVGQGDIELVDEDYRFFLEVKLRAYGGRTRITAKASPMYRIRDLDAEGEAYGESAGGETGVDLKVRGDAGAAVAMGPIFIAPIDGRPSDYRVLPLPDAGERAGKLVRSFMYLLDRRIAAGRSADPVTR